MAGSAALALLAVQIVTALEGPALGAVGPGPATRGETASAAPPQPAGERGTWLVVRRPAAEPAAETEVAALAR